MCSALEIVLSFAGGRPGFDLRIFSLPADGYEKIGKGFCPYTDAHDKLACAGIVDLFDTGAGAGDPPPEQKAYAQQVLGWVAPIKPGVRFSVDELIHEMQDRDRAVLENPELGGDRK